MTFAGGLFVVGFVAALVLAGLTLYLFLSERMTVRQFAFWEAVSVAIVVFTIFPGVLEWTAGLVGVTQRGIFVVTMGVLGAYVLIYSLTVYQRKTEKEIRKLNQEIALLRYQVEYGSDSDDDRE
jgi:hypothetical protein